MQNIYSTLKTLFSSKKVKYSIIASLIPVLILAVLIFLKFFISFAGLENYIFEKTRLKVEFVKPKVSFNLKTDLVFNADEINVYNFNKTKKLIYVSNPAFTFKPLFLAVKKLNIKKLSADKIQVDIYRDKEGKTEFFELLKNNKIFLSDKKPKLTRLSLNIKNIDFNYKDDYETESNINFNFSDLRLNLSKRKKIFEFSQKSAIKTTVNSNQNISLISTKIVSSYPFNSLKSDDLNLDIKLDKFDLYVLNDLAKKYISKDIVKLSGTADLNIITEQNKQKVTSNLKNLQLDLADLKTVIPYKKDILTTLTFNLNKNNLQISDFNLTSDNLDIKLDSDISELFSKHCKVNLKTKISNTQLNNFLYLLPDNLIYYNLEGIPALKKSNFHAKLDGDIDVSLFPLKMQGSLKASNVYIPAYPKPYNQNDVNFYFMNDKVRTYTRVYTPQNEYVTVDGVSNLDDSLYGKYSVNSTQNIDLAFAKLYLVPIQKILGFNIGPVPIMDISGFGNIDIKTQGTIFDAQIFGKFSAKNAAAKINGLDALLKNGTCELVFDNRNLIFKKIKGKIFNSDFLLSGVGNTKGDVNLNAKIDNVSFANALKIMENSAVFNKYSVLTKNISAVSGLTDVRVNFKGTINDYEDINFLNNLEMNGDVNFKNNIMVLKNKLKLQNLNGRLLFGQAQKADLDFKINNSKFYASFDIEQELEKIFKNRKIAFNSFIMSPKISSNDILKELISLNLIDESYFSSFENLKQINFYSKLNLASKGVISLDKFDLSNISNKGYLVFLNDKDNQNIKFNSGIIKFENDKLILNNIIAAVKDGSVKINGSIDKFLSKKPSHNVEARIENLDLDDYSGIFRNIKLNNCLLKNAEISLKNDTVHLHNINLNYDLMPVFINASIKDIYKSKSLDADFSAILNETATDNIINPFLSYPVKIKGEIPLKGNFKGKFDRYMIDIAAKIPKNSDISFSGANIGDIEYNRELQSKISVEKDTANIQNLKLLKYIKNQNNKTIPLTLLKINGQLRQAGEDFLYKNFKISTSTPMNVRTLNMIFKKSILKQGNFECAINLQGNVKNPKVTGMMKLQDLDIPLYDTKVNSIYVDINDKYINGSALAKSKESDVDLTFKAQNKLTPPFNIEKLNIKSNKLNISDLINSLEPQNSKTDITLKNEAVFKTDDLIIKDGEFLVSDVTYNKIQSKNLQAFFNFKDDIFELSDLSFDIAQGVISGKGRYDLNKNTLKLDAKMKDCSSGILANLFLNLDGQIFGRMNGSLSLSAKGLNTPDNIKNIKSNVEFEINNGKMPKLGSLEYLLRAGNLIKNGLLGLSLNNLIQVLTPYKTGEFEEISGKFTLGGGEVRDLEIISKGKNLSMYLDGNYDILKNFADIKIYGKLSQSVSNVLGNIGNASIKQVIDALSPNKNAKNQNSELIEKIEKIPSVEGQNSDVKYFKVKVLGDINKDNYIKSFNWM